MNDLLIGSGSNSNISLSGASGITRDSDSDTLYIVCSSGHRIVSYPSGNVVAVGHGAGYNPSQLNALIGLIYDSFSKSFIIANNYGAHNILRWVLGDSNWTLLAVSLTGLIGNTSTLFNQLVGVTLNPMGNVYVADTYNHCIQFFFDGQPDDGMTGIPGFNSTLVSFPYWIKLDNQLNLYMSDTFNGRIQKFLRY